MTKKCPNCPSVVPPGDEVCRICQGVGAPVGHTSAQPKAIQSQTAPLPETEVLVEALTKTLSQVAIHPKAEAKPWKSVLMIVAPIATVTTCSIGVWRLIKETRPPDPPPVVELAKTTPPKIVAPLAENGDVTVSQVFERFIEKADNNDRNKNVLRFQRAYGGGMELVKMTKGAKLDENGKEIPYYNVAITALPGSFYYEMCDYKTLLSEAKDAERRDTLNNELRKRIVSFIEFENRLFLDPKKGAKVDPEKYEGKIQNYMDQVNDKTLVPAWKARHNKTMMATFGQAFSFSLRCDGNTMQ